MKKTLKKNNVGFIQTDKAFFVQNMVAKKKLQFLDQLYGKMSDNQTSGNKTLKLKFSAFFNKL